MEKKSNEKKDKGIILKELEELRKQLAVKKRKLEKIENVSRLRKPKLRDVDPTFKQNVLPTKKRPFHEDDQLEILNNAESRDHKNHYGICERKDAPVCDSALDDINVNFNSSIPDSLELWLQNDRSYLLESEQAHTEICLNNNGNTNKFEKLVQTKFADASDVFKSTNGLPDGTRNAIERCPNDVSVANSISEQKEVYLEQCNISSNCSGEKNICQESNRSVGKNNLKFSTHNKNEHFGNINLLLFKNNSEVKTSELDDNVVRLKNISDENHVKFDSANVSNIQSPQENRFDSISALVSKIEMNEMKLSSHIEKRGAKGLHSRSHQDNLEITTKKVVKSNEVCLTDNQTEIDTVAKADSHKTEIINQMTVDISNLDPGSFVELSALEVSVGNFKNECDNENTKKDPSLSNISSSYELKDACNILISESSIRDTKTQIKEHVKDNQMLNNDKSKEPSAFYIDDFEDDFEAEYLSWLAKQEYSCGFEANPPAVTKVKEDMKCNIEFPDKSPYEVWIEKSKEMFDKKKVAELIEEEKEIILYQKCLEEIPCKEVIDLSVFSLGCEYFVVIFLATEIRYYETCAKTYRVYSKYPLPKNEYRIYKGFHVHDSKYAIIGIIYMTTNGYDHLFFGMELNGVYNPLTHIKCEPLTMQKQVDINIYCLNYGFISAIEGENHAFVNVFSVLEKNVSLSSLKIDLCISPNTSVCRASVLHNFFVCDSGYLSLWEYDSSCIKQITPCIQRLPLSCKIEYASCTNEAYIVLVSGYSDDNKSNQCRTIMMNIFDSQTHFLDFSFESLMKNGNLISDVKVLVDEFHGEYVYVLVENQLRIFHFWSGNTLVTLDCEGHVSKISCGSNLLVFHLFDGCLRVVALKDPSLVDMQKRLTLKYQWS